GLPVFTAIRPRARCLSTTHGKGLTATAAAVSALMEALEMHAAEQAAPDLVALTPAEVREAGYQPRHRGAPLRRDRALDETAALDWSLASNLAGERRWAVPFDIVHLDYRPARFAASPFVISTNGLASGNSREEACLYGLCELAERDAIGRRAAKDPWLAMAGAPAVDLASVPEGPCRSLLDRIRAAGIEVRAWYLAGPATLPTIYVRLIERETHPLAPPPVDGAGCDPEPLAALVHALAEAAQNRIVLISGTRDDLSAPTYLRRAVTAEPGEALPLDALPRPAAASLGETLRRVAEVFEQEGRQPLFVDLSPAGSGLSVVRSVVPSLLPLMQAHGSRPAAQAAVLESGR
ncbi:MAG TPA: YcaO-like family protein, partial [Kiloniellales bacterium]|nr:YcaO-like family protein [Kiloniellales bacterium]